MSKDIIAIIPARGGSKRLPRKNILPILKRPIITYPLETAIQSEIFDQVIVSSEDDEILDIVSTYNCRTINRPDNLAQDTSTVVQVCSHVLDILSKESSLPSFFCLIYATAIFINKQDIIQSFELFFKKPFPDVIMGVSDFNLQPMQAMIRGKDGFMKPRWPGQIKKQSQRQPHFVASNGTLYWSKTESFLKNPSFYVKKLQKYSIPSYRAVDINTREDFIFAEKIAPLFIRKSQ